MSHFKPLSDIIPVEVGEKVEGQTRARRAPNSKDKLVDQPFEGIDTVYDIVQYATRTHGTKDAMGYRDIVDTVEEEKEITKVVGGKEVKEKKTWKYFQLSDPKYISFNELQQAIDEVGLALIDLGITQEDILNIYAQTSMNWQLVSLACCSIGTPIATAYDSLGESGLQHSLNEPQCPAVFTNAELLPVVSKVMGNVPSLRLVIYDGEPKQDLLDKIRGVREGIKVVSIDELRAIGKGLPRDVLSTRIPKREATACIMYTSGTTGAPKGVVITHSNLVATVGAVYVHLAHHFREGDVYLSYLPLAHILEFVIELSLTFIGMTLGFGRVKTLTDQSVRNCVGDMRAFRPSVLVGVPAVFEMIRKGIVQKLNSGGKLKKSVFNASMTVKKANVPGLTQLVDSAVLSQVKVATGGRLRIAMCGGAALGQETQEFLNLALVTLLQGYGLTETCGMCSVLLPERFKYGTVGFVMPSVEVILKDVPDAGYFSTNNPPQGEVLIRGGSVIKGYYKRDDLNNDESIFTKDGWFRTGDVGQFNEDGSMSIIDRIKNLVKLSGGEYIALERLESVYKGCNLAANVCVHASQDAKQPIAIIIPNEPHLRHALETNPIPGVNSREELTVLCKNTKVQELVMKDCNSIGKKAGFKPLEMLEAVILTADEWTPESGLVTAAQKIQRKKVAERYSAEIKEVYKNQ
ncbi:acetyl-CoA synthetase-like protein [Trametopsis cervina]|nr:acetyl-CoA synthetase-like protein [Trametopsis cervina]